MNKPSDHERDHNNTPQDERPNTDIRPGSPEPLRKRIMPKVPKPSTSELMNAEQPASAEPDPSLPPDERVTSALNRLRKKMSAVAEEYSRGEINRAQFDAIYHRYQEQRQITERLLDRDPTSDAWQSVVKPGHTSFLRNQYKAKVESYAIYHLGNGQQIVRTGHVQIPEDQAQPIVQRLRAVIDPTQIPLPAHRVLPDRRWVVFVPGRYSLAIVIFSLEPAPAQVKTVKDIHSDFERANAPALSRNTWDRHGMVFPHRALFEL